MCPWTDSPNRFNKLFANLLYQFRKNQADFFPVNRTAVIRDLFEMTGSAYCFAAILSNRKNGFLEIFEDNNKQIHLILP